MSLADKFHSNRGAALALSTLLAVTSVAAPFQTASAQEPANANRPVATQVTATNNLSPAAAQLIEAYKFSYQGVSLVVVLNKNDTVAKYKSDLAAVMRTTKDNNVPAKIFPFQSDEPSHAYFVRNAIEFRRPPNQQNYSMSEILQMGGDAISIYGQSLKADASTPHTTPVSAKPTTDTPTVAMALQ
jgi:hypothetical protein